MLPALLLLLGAAASLAAPIPKADTDAHPQIWGGGSGGPRWKKDAEPHAEPHAEPQGWWGGGDGAPHWKKEVCEKDNCY
ncbi:hypothetical protein Q8F55_000670 [Vanrija albida]|uniref:Uncharacterized protein n=1 Tax=Vanrija albida TaxID=181172 RepID=A0ABR3QEX2_9TREE